MRTFKKIKPQWLTSDDGVSVYTVDQFTRRYEQVGRYCDLRADALIRDQKVYGEALRLLTPWVYPDDRMAPISASDLVEIRSDLTAAYQQWKLQAVFRRGELAAVGND